MKIAYLVKSISRKSGGLFDSCRRLAQTIAHRHNITVLGLADEFTSNDIGDWAPLQPIIFRALGPPNFGYSLAYKSELAATAPDLTHVHGLWTYPSLAGYLWHRHTNRPVLYSAHGMLDPWALRSSRWKKRLARILWEGAAHRSAICFHALSQGEYLAFRRYGLRNPICIIPSGVDLPDLELQNKDRGPLTTEHGSGMRVLLYLGRLHPKKNLIALLKAWRQVRNSESWVLAIAGWDQGGYEGELKHFAREVGLSVLDIGNQTSSGVIGQWSAISGRRSAAPFVVFLGPQFGAAKDACYRACDALVLPSLSEGLPMTVLEAWAYAKPVAMTPECNLPQGVAERAAIQIGTKDVDIARGLTQLLDMANSDRKQMGALGRALVAEKFSWPCVGEQMCKVYEWVLGGGVPPEMVRFDSRKPKLGG